MYGSGEYAVRPVYAEDLAAQEVKAGSQRENSVAVAARLDTFSFAALVRLLASAIAVRVRAVHTPPPKALALIRMVSLLTSGESPAGTTRLSDWLAEQADGLGRRYVSELQRNYRR